MNLLPLATESETAFVENSKSAYLKSKLIFSSGPTSGVDVNVHSFIAGNVTMYLQKYDLPVGGDLLGGLG